MIIRMEKAERLSLAEMQAIVLANEEVRFVGQARKDAYEWVQRVLVEHTPELRLEFAQGLARGVAQDVWLARAG